MRLQSIVFPEPEICTVEELYYHKERKQVHFDGYFNLFYIEKRKKYTDLKKLFLRIRAKGYRTLSLMHDKTCIKKEKLDPWEEKEYCFEFPYEKMKTGVFWFSMEEAEYVSNINAIENAKKSEMGVGQTLTEETPDSKRILSGYFEGVCEEVRPVNLAVVICTYKREEYVLRNLKNVKKRFLQRTDLEAAEHFRMWLVDNGRTLNENEEILKTVEDIQRNKRSGMSADVSGKTDADTEEEPLIRIFPNKNTGGAGGFTRGMLEALKRKEKLELTHVLLMDDDAVFDPEVFVRTYGCLTTLKEEYKNITLGGTLLREDFPYIQQAGGEKFEHFLVKNENPLADLRTFEACTSHEMCRTDREKELYSGWWCCCYSLEIVREDNLPIPLFIHRDDIEYEIRNRESGIAFFNGIGVWHKGFEVNFIGTNYYYDVRNTLIYISLHEKKRTKREVKCWILKMILVALMEYRYGEAKLILKGVEDFCRGSRWLYYQDAEKLNQSIIHILKNDNFDEKILSEREQQIVENEILKYKQTFGLKQIKNYYSPQRHKGNLKKIITYNGWFLPNDRKVEAISCLDSPYRGYRKSKIVLFEPFTEKQLVTKKDWKKFLEIIYLYFEILRIMKKYYEKSVESYRKNWIKIINQKSWEEYLKF